MLQYLLLLLAWPNIVTGSVYNVTPTDHYCPSCLLNITTSSTQLIFLPGLHHLHTDLIIQNVHNISLIGSSTPDTVIQCNSSVGIVMTNITNLIVTNITVRSCLGNQYNNATVLIKQCTNVQLRHVVIEENHNSYGIVGINVLGDSRFSHLKSNSLKISFRELIVDKEKHNVTIDHCHISDDHMEYKIELNFLQIAYSVKVTILQSSFRLLRNSWSIIHAFFEHEATGLLIIKQCQFANNNMNLVYIKQPLVYGVLYDFIYIEDSLFVNNSFSFTGPIESQFIRISRNFNVYITNCTFHNNSNGITIHKRTHLYLGLHLKVFVISNTTFSSSSTHNDVVLIRLVSVDLHLKGPVIFNNISGFSSIILLIKSKITCSNYIEISTSNSTAIINYETDKTNFVILVMEHTTINITHNNFKKFSDIL